MKSESEIQIQLEDLKTRLIGEVEDPRWFQGYANALLWVLTVDKDEKATGGEEQ